MADQQTDRVPVHTVERLSAEAPAREAELLVLTEGYSLGDEFVIQRRVSFLPGMRWDACEMEVTPFGPHMMRVGFGTTRRGARRHMRRDRRFSINEQGYPPVLRGGDDRG